MTVATATPPVDDFVIAGNVAEPAPEPAEAQAATQEAQAGADEATETPREAQPAKPAETAVDDAAASEAGRVLAGRKKSAQQRIDEITWEREEQRRRADRLEQELQRRSSSADPQAGPSPASATASAPTRPEPALESFSAEPDPYLAWTRALAKWDREQERVADEAARAKADADQRQQADTAAHTVRERAFAAAHPDFQTVISTSTAPVSPAMRAAILQSDRGPEIMYHLAQHSEVCADLARETASVGRESVGLVRRLLETRLEAAPSGSASSAPVTTSAKPPIRPVGSSPVVASEGPPDDSADLDAHAQYYNRLDREARRR